MASYKTIKNFVNLYDPDDKVIDYLPEGTKLDVSEIIRSGKDRKIAILSDGNYVVASYRNIEAIQPVKKTSKKGSK